ncbi:uncharacterized protein LOC124402175 isoform X2 [Silurus meridionalis]|uniref:uncharacterized protein LOC124402175 isoform X2 n=1 Tax=Silurus meridionalis TaxID=175797 RepID=UPI001EEC4FF9|nr:uncharacterized protein LOC124402175 isoform X2 [Silurus meridionalis]
MWQKQEMCLMLVIVMMLNSSTFCLELNGHKSESVQAGRLIIESSKPTNETKHDIFKNLHEEYVGVTNGSPSYQPESIGSQLAKLVLRHWSPSVQCDNDSMSLRIRGTQIPKFLVETSKGGPVPLLRMPPHCGFSMKRARRDVSLVAKYNGCNVAQQGNAYVLPLRASGVVLKVVCPVGRPLTRVSCTPSAMVVNLGVAADGVKLKVKGVWQPIYQAATICGFTLEVIGGGLTLTVPYTSNCWQYEGAKVILSLQCMDGELTLSCPAVQPSTTTPLLAFMQPVPRKDAPMTTSTTTTTLATTKEPVSADEQLSNPLLHGVQYGYGIPWPFQYNQPGSFPATYANAALSTATKVVPARPQQHLHPWLPGIKQPYGYGMPWPFQYSNPGTLPDTHTNTAQTSGTIVAAASPDQLGLYPWLVGTYYPYSYPLPWQIKYSQSGAPPATTSTTATPTTTLTTTTPATTTTTSTTTSKNYPTMPRSFDQQWYPWLLGTYNQYVPMVPPGVSVSGPNGGVKQQMYQTSWMNSLPKYPTVNQNPGSSEFNPSKILPYHSNVSPLQIKLGQ